MTTDNRFYTYVWRRADSTPYYVGKGRWNRAYRAGSPKDRRLIIVEYYRDEMTAFHHERKLIASFGRIDKGSGVLRNRTDGGDGTSGWIPSKEVKQKIRVANTGRRHSLATRRRLSEVGRGNRNKAGKKCSEASRLLMRERNLGKTIPEEQRRKIGDTLRGRRHSEESIRKQADAQRGRNRGRTGLTNSPEMRHRQSEALRGRKYSPERCRYISEGQRAAFAARAIE